MTGRHRSTITTLALALTAACGGGGGSGASPDSGGGDADGGGDPAADSGPELSCAYPGSATWQGTVDGQEIATPRSAWVAIEADNAWWIVGVDEGGSTCLGLSSIPGGEPPPDGFHGLDLLFFGAPASGTYQVVPYETEDAPADAVYASFQATDGEETTDLAHGVSGTVTFEVIGGEGGCFTGTYDVTFEGLEGAGGGSSSGAFAGYSCTGG